jgi:hypothetical protein
MFFEKLMLLSGGISGAQIATAHFGTGIFLTHPITTLSTWDGCYSINMQCSFSLYATEITIP